VQQSLEARRRAEALEAERNKRLQEALEALRSGSSRRRDRAHRALGRGDDWGSEELTGPPPVDEAAGGRAAAADLAPRQP
jgi:hypothetical protein